MRLFLSALLLLAAFPAASAQNQASGGPAGDPAAHRISPPGMEPGGCPVELTSATVAPKAGYLPVNSRTAGDGALDLHFRNESGRPIRSASVTAHLQIKTNIYSLDAAPLDLRLTFSGTDDLDWEADQIRNIPLPGHLYLFGVARVALDKVTWADGAIWTAAAGDTCSVSGLGSERIEAK